MNALIKFETFFSRLSCQTCGLRIRIIFKVMNEFALKWLNVYLKSVKFLFLFSIVFEIRVPLLQVFNGQICKGQ